MGRKPIPGGEVGPLGYRRSLARNNHSPYVEPAGGALHHLLQQHGYCDHSFHRYCPRGHAPADHKAAEADAGNDGSAAKDAGDTGPLRPGPAAGFPGNDAAVPGGGRKPRWLPGAVDHPDAHPVRAVPRPDSDGLLEAGPPGGFGGEVLRLDTILPHLHGRAAKRHLPLAGPVGTGPIQRNHSGPGFRLHLAPAENDHDAVDRPPSVDEPDDDAVADAADDRVFLVHPAQRTVPVLDSLQRHRYRYPVFRNGVATHIPAVPEGRAGACRRTVIVQL